MAKIGDITGKAVKALTGSRPGKDQASNANDPSTPDQFSKSFNKSSFFKNSFCILPFSFLLFSN